MSTAERTLWRDVSIPVSRTVPEKLTALVLPGSLTFQGTSFYDVLAFLRQEATRLDTGKADEQLRGVPVWIVDGSGQRCTSAQAGESRALDALVARVFCHLEFTRVPLGTALDVLARHFALEMQVTETAVFLWLPGRDAKAYLTGKTVAERFHYDYSDAEIAEVSERPQGLAKQADEVHVVFNNNSRDFAPVAAERLRRRLG